MDFHCLTSRPLAEKVVSALYQHTSHPLVCVFVFICVSGLVCQINILSSNQVWTISM